MIGLGNKKIGRPTDNPKDISLKVRLDNDTAKKLNECAKEINVSKAEIVRRGIHKFHDGLNKK
ncbi:ribbon-helix-helix domain-containing protein [Lutispora saccharofermentans]|uniref:Ribbon-helix-helix domain-containing protein n=1 Tax=Lutispora saccharofermentans TaxID=3024236 RepID=A0ABT1NIL0_9FIRM|nr:ribbon-helix-helix domain-containing protein [Lutispora saccharofermentans]